MKSSTLFTIIYDSNSSIYNSNNISVKISRLTNKEYSYSDSAPYTTDSMLSKNKILCSLISTSISKLGLSKSYLINFPK